MAKATQVDSLSDRQFQEDLLYEQYYSAFEPAGITVIVCSD